MPTTELRYWDSNVFVAWINGEEGRVDVCEEIVRMARKGDCVICTSAVTLAEVLRPGKRGTRNPEFPPETETQIAAFFRNTFIRVVDFTEPLGELARNLQWDHGLHVRDSIHAACAIHAKAEYLETFDDRFTRLNDAEVSGYPTVREPQGKSMPLFDSAEKTAPKPDNASKDGDDRGAGAAKKRSGDGARSQEKANAKTTKKARTKTKTKSKTKAKTRGRASSPEKSN